jgi:hypothetical protein
LANKYAGRTAREFETAVDVWNIVDSWAQQNGYMPADQDQTSRLYQRGKGFWLAPQMLKLSTTETGYRLEAWVKTPLFNRIVTLGLMPPEIIIESGGFMAVLPRDKARLNVNSLLQALGLPPIE